MNALGRSPRSQLKTFFSSHGLKTTKQVKEESIQENPTLKRKGNSKKVPKKEAKQQPKVQVIKSKPYKKKKISGALREAVWIKTMGRKFEGKCPVVWCPNTITAFDFQAGHNVPESKGGSTTLPNLIAICARCNFSMGNQYTIDEWNVMHAPGTQPVLSDTPNIPQQPLKISWFKRFCCCFFRRAK